MECEMKIKPTNEECENCDYRIGDECIHDEVKDDGFRDERFDD